jgi:thiamine pyrophosphate-dependent acetolactate synthase large subunit-like protein
MGKGGGNPIKKVTKEIKRATDKNPWLAPVTTIIPIDPLTQAIGVGTSIDDEIVDPIEDRKKEMKDEMKRREQEQRQIEEDIQKERESTEERSSEVGRKARAVARRLQRARQRSTILTSGLGVPGEAPTAQKTLLGR